MNQEHLQQVEAKILEMCPELQELTFGCEFTEYKTQPPCKVIKVCDDNVFYCENDGSIELESKGLWDQRCDYLPYLYKNKITIIGHTITLHFCLKAIDQTSAYRVISLWEYNRTDNLKDQPEAVEFLYGVLCNQPMK